MYEFLKKLFEKGALTFDQFVEALNSDSSIKLVNLADGGYVPKADHDSKVGTLTTELNGVKDQLQAANDQIQSYKDMDIDGIKQSATQWKEKYDTETQALKDKIASQQIEFAAKTYLGGFHFANDLVKEAIYSKFMEKKFPMEGEKFLGADDFMAELKKANPSAFVDDAPGQPDTPPAGPDPNNAPPKNKPWFAPQQPPANPGKKRSLLEMMKYHNEHPDAPINFDA